MDSQKIIKELQTTVLALKTKITILESRMCDCNKESESSSKIWKPECDEKYYYIDDEVAVLSETWGNESVHEDGYAIGNCFKTKEEAELAVEKLGLLAKFKRYALEHDARAFTKYLPEYFPTINERGELYVDCTRELVSPLQFFTSEQVCVDAVKHIGGIEKLRLLLEQ